MLEKANSKNLQQQKNLDIPSWILCIPRQIRIEGLSETVTTAHCNILCGSTPRSGMLTGSNHFPVQEPHLRPIRRLRRIKSATQKNKNQASLQRPCSGRYKPTVSPPAAAAHRRWNVPLRFKLNSARGIRFHFSHARPSAISNPATATQWAWKKHNFPAASISRALFSPALRAEQLPILQRAETYPRETIASSTDGCCHADK